MKTLRNFYNILFLAILFFLAPILIKAEEPLQLNQDIPHELTLTPTVQEVIEKEETTILPKIEETTEPPEEISIQEQLKPIPSEPKVAPFENQTQFPPEPEKMEYLRSKINPGKKHQFAARCAAMILGNSCRNRNLKKLRKIINNTIDEQYDKQTEKIFTPKAIFLFMINYGFKCSLYLAKMGISVATLSTEAEKISRQLAQVDWAEIEDDTLLLGDIFLAKKLNDWFLPEKDRELLLAGAGGSIGTLGYILYYKFFFSDIVCLERTLTWFKSNPENFPAAAFMILKKAESLMDNNTLDKKTAALVCEQLRDMSRPK